MIDHNGCCKGKPKPVRDMHDWIAAIIVTLMTILILASCDQTPAHAEDINLERIAWIESRHQAMAYNARSGATGMYQITEGALTDFCRLTGVYYNINDMYEPQKAAKVANWYLNERIPQLLRHYHKADTVENRLIAYNAGILAVLKGRLPKETANYIKQYKVAVGSS